jgi:hypothetical protein
VASQSALYNGNWGPEGGQKGGEIFEFEEIMVKKMFQINESYKPTYMRKGINPKQKNKGRGK